MLTIMYEYLLVGQSLEIFKRSVSGEVNRLKIEQKEVYFSDAFWKLMEETKGEWDNLSQYPALSIASITEFDRIILSPLEKLGIWILALTNGRFILSQCAVIVYCV